MMAALLTTAPPLSASSTLSSCAGRRPRKTCGWSARVERDRLSRVCKGWDAHRAGFATPVGVRRACGLRQFKFRGVNLTEQRELSNVEVHPAALCALNEASHRSQPAIFPRPGGVIQCHHIRRDKQPNCCSLPAWLHYGFTCSGRPHLQDGTRMVPERYTGDPHDSRKLLP